ncbi:MAG: hypothetical protein EBR30_24275, partial [Cytophagia bacterium]|nr:hypothetical protein [Cytophagia bacterium]
LVKQNWDGEDPLEAFKLTAKYAADAGLMNQAMSAAMQVKAMEADRLKTEQQGIKTSYEIGRLAAQTREAISKADQAKTAKIPSLIQLQDARDSIDEALQTEQDPQKREVLETRKNELNNAIKKESTREPRATKEPNKVGVSTTGQVVYYDPETRKQFTFDSQGKEVPFTGQIREGGSTTNVVLNTPQTAALVAQGQQATKQIFERVQSIDRSITLIDQNTPFSEAALRQEIASIFGDSQKAATEIRNLANTGSLDERIANRIVDFVSGKPTKVTNEDRRAVLVALRKRERDQYERRLNPFRQAIKKESGGDPNAIFPSFEEAFGQTPGVVSVQRKTKSGTEYTVE